jgi:hypothetical protein
MGVSPRVLAEDSVNTLVVSHVYNGYTRTKLPGGGFKSEAYIFAKGGMLDEVGVGGDSVGVIGFDQVARTVADALKTQGYENHVSSSDPEKIDEIIVLGYGATIKLKKGDPGYEVTRVQHTRILGFEKEQSRADSLAFAAFNDTFYDEFNADRYFVLLKAYDFQVARKEKRLKLLWETRFSIRRQGVDFATELPAMSKFAALTFGRETGGIFDPTSRETSVKLGDLKILEQEKP